MDMMEALAIVSVVTALCAAAVLWWEYRTPRYEKDADDDFTE
jgi:hypothetical protein